MKFIKSGLSVLALILAALGWFAAPSILADSSSTNYRVTETSLGGSGQNGATSTHYQTQQAVGILGVGSSASASFQSAAGNITTGDPALAFGITNSTPSFGAFSAGTAATATAVFQVVNYTSYGYIVQIAGTPPTNTYGHTIAAMSTTGPSQVGTEQFGINLVANTSPISFGANPVQGINGVGAADSNYGTSNNFRYVSGETIASAPKSSGLTTYTISYIVNVNSLTPGGDYNGSQTLVCTGTY